jgi:RHS repeat-associated protein
MLPVSVNGTSAYAQTIAYDSAMRMIQLIRGANILNTVYTYNAWNVDGGRLLTLSTTRPSDGATLQNYTYDYDPVGNINTITDSQAGPQTQTFTYDALDRLTNANITGGTNGLYSEGYIYDSSTGNLSSKAGVAYAYNSGHAHAVSSLSNGNSYSYDANGNMTNRTVGGYASVLNYDAEGRLVSVTGNVPPPTASPTPVVPTATATLVPTATLTPTSTATATRTPTNTPTRTPLPTSTPSNTPTPRNTPTPCFPPIRCRPQGAPEPILMLAPQATRPASAQDILTSALALPPSPASLSLKVLAMPALDTVSSTFMYDGDGNRVAQTVNGVTTYFVGNYYEKKGTTVTKYYFAGATRLAVRTNGTLSYLLGDHLGSSSVTTNASGVKTASALYKAFGETRYSSGALGTDYKFTGQREQAELGLYFYGARWYDGSLGRFIQPDSIVPTSTQGTQAWDRYAYVSNNPVKYTDPTGHALCDEEYSCGSDSGASQEGPEDEDNVQPGFSKDDCKDSTFICGGNDSMGYIYDPVSGMTATWYGGSDNVIYNSLNPDNPDPNLAGFMASVNSYDSATTAQEIAFVVAAGSLAAFGIQLIFKPEPVGLAIAGIGFIASVVVIGISGDVISDAYTDAGKYWSGISGG